MIHSNLKKRLITSFLLIVLFLLFVFSKIMLIYGLIIIGVMSIIEFLNLMKKNDNKNFFKFISNINFFNYIFFFCTFFIYFIDFIHLKILIFILILVCSASDIGGFIFGKTFKGPKLTKISPQKTISGAFGSIFLSSLMMPLLVLYFTSSFNYLFIIIGAIISVACQLGDLFFSYLKRKAKIKDTGNFLPGHGGILDRIDGILFGLPIGFCALILFS